MANPRLCWNALLAQIKEATNNIPLNIVSGIDWPAQDLIQQTTHAGNALISIFDRGEAHDSTRWLQYPCTPIVINATGITSTLSNTVIPSGESVTITLGGTPNINDNVSAVLQNYTTTICDVAIAAGGDTPSIMATKLAAAVTADSTASTWVTASAVGAVITITNILSVGELYIASNTGNMGSQTQEVARTTRPTQVTVWTQVEEQRELVASAIEVLLANLQYNFGLSLSDGTYARVLKKGDQYQKDFALKDIYRADFFIDIEYGITYSSPLWQITGIVPAYSL